MKYLLLTRLSVHRSHGGAGNYYYNIFKRFPKGEVTVFTMLFNDSEQNFTDLNLNFINRSYIKNRSEKMRVIRFFCEARMLLFWLIESFIVCIKKKIKCIFIGNIFPIGLLGLSNKLLLGTPYIIFVHGEEISQIQNDITRKMKQLFMKHAYRIIANSEFTVDLVKSYGINKNRIIKINPMVDSDFYRPDIEHENIRKRYGLENHKVLLTVGRLATDRKGHAKVIMALPHVLKKVPNVKYLIVGSDLGAGDKLRQLVKELRLEKEVVFVGHVDQNDLPKYYCACDIFIMANYELESGDTEGFGMVFLEANACGKPVIGGCAGGTKDAIVDGETGLLINALDENALTKAIIKLATEEEYAKQMGLNGLKRARDSFNWTKAYVMVQRELDKLLLNLSE